MNNFPIDWTSYSLKEICNPTDKYSFTGGPFGSNLKNEHYTETGVRIIQLQNIGDGVFLDSYKIYTSGEKADELKSCNIYPGDLILAKMAEPVARACFVPNGTARYLMCSDGIRVSIDKDKFDSKYICYFINSKFFRENAEKSSSGSTRLRISLKELSKLPIHSPTLPEQKRIAEILTSVDDAIQATEKVIVQAKKVKQGLLQDLLTRGIGHKKFKKTEIGKIPESWRVAQIQTILDALIDCEHKTAPYVEDQNTYFVARTNNIKDGNINWDNAKFTDYGSYKTWTKRGEPEIGDIMFTREAPAGEAALVPRNVKTCLGQRMVLLKPNKNIIMGEFLLSALYSPRVNSKIKARMIGTTVTRINMSDISKIPVPIPPLVEQDKIVKIVSEIENSILENKKKFASLYALKSGLMQDLLTGRVRVRGVA